MGQFLVRVEGVNLASSIMDTEDLSVIRGGGFANLLIPELIADCLNLGPVTPIFAGASQAEFLLDAGAGVSSDEVEFRLEAVCSGRSPLGGERVLAAVLPHLTVVAAAVPYQDDYVRAARHAMGRIRIIQLKNLSVDRGVPPAATSRRPCMVDGLRPAESEISKGDRRLAVSASVRSRQELGRTLRQQIYKRIGVRSDRELAYADSFADLVNDPPAGLPPSLKGKMAVVYLDGNKFTAARERFVTDQGLAGATAFSRLVTDARAVFLDRLLDALENDKRMFCDGRLRFEILMWGGDEARFVLPAWKVADLLPLLAGDMEADHWKLPTGRLTNAIGILVCHHKTPIARAAELASDIVDEIKSHQKAAKSGSPRDMLSIQLIESIEPPAGGIARFREKLYGVIDRSAFVILDASGLRDFVASYSRITDPKMGIPRSQLYNLISDERLRGVVNDADVSREEFEKAIVRAVRRSRGDAGELAVKSLSDALKDPAFGISEARPFLGLVRMAEMWDLMQPFASSNGVATETA